MPGWIKYFLYFLCLQWLSSLFFLNHDFTLMIYMYMCKYGKTNLMHWLMENTDDYSQLFHTGKKSWVIFLSLAESNIIKIMMNANNINGYKITGERSHHLKVSISTHLSVNKSRVYIQVAKCVMLGCVTCAFLSHNQQDRLSTQLWCTSRITLVIVVHTSI